jgi:hypothetical protein
MFNLKSMFTSKRDEEITSLHLQTPGPEPSRELPATPLQAAAQVHAEELRNSAVAEEIKRRAKQLLDAGKYPANIFVLMSPETKGLVSFKTQKPAFNSLLFFSSPLIALDFVRTTKTPAQVAGIKMEGLPSNAEIWRKNGIDSFVWDRCPRCNIHVTQAPKDQLITKDHLALAWATRMCIRGMQAERLIRQFMAPGGKDGLAQKRAMLEMLRDHVAYDVPYAHWLIGLFAAMQGDEPARMAATACLEEFGPDFKGKIPAIAQDSKELPAPWIESMAQAQVGLLSAFGLLNLSPKPSQPQPQSA